jgi:hypothetical protein
MIQSWLRSLQLRLAMRVAALYIVATVVVILVLMSRAYDTARSLSDQELIFRATDLARYDVSRCEWAAPLRSPAKPDRGL